MDNQQKGRPLSTEKQTETTQEVQTVRTDLKKVMKTRIPQAINDLGGVAKTQDIKAWILKEEQAQKIDFGLCKTEGVLVKYPKGRYYFDISYVTQTVSLKKKGVLFTPAWSWLSTSPDAELPSGVKAKLPRNRAELIKPIKPKPISQEEGAISQEEGAISQEEGAISQEEGAISQEEGAISQEEGAISQEEGAISQEEGAISQEEAQDEILVVEFETQDREKEYLEKHGEDSLTPTGREIDVVVNLNGQRVGIDEKGREWVEAQEEEEEEEWYDKPFSSFNLKNRTKNALSKAGHINFLDIEGMATSELLGLKGFGRNSLKEIQELLESFGEKSEGWLLKRKKREEIAQVEEVQVEEVQVEEEIAQVEEVQVEEVQVEEEVQIEEVQAEEEMWDDLFEDEEEGLSFLPKSQYFGEVTTNDKGKTLRVVTTEGGEVGVEIPLYLNESDLEKGEHTYIDKTIKTGIKLYLTTQQQSEEDLLGFIDKILSHFKTKYNEKVASSNNPIAYISNVIAWSNIHKVI